MMVAIIIDTYDGSYRPVSDCTVIEVDVAQEDHIAKMSRVDRAAWAAANAQRLTA